MFVKEKKKKVHLEIYGDSMGELFGVTAMRRDTYLEKKQSYFTMYESRIISE